MSFLRSVWHDLFGHTSVYRHHDSECSECAYGASFCRDCGGHFRIEHPPIGNIRL